MGYIKHLISNESRFKVHKELNSVQMIQTSVYFVLHHLGIVIILLVSKVPKLQVKNTCKNLIFNVLIFTFHSC